ncbi:MAG: large subunit ribosomal protein L2 [Candidatus Woesearchaeota archaeon]|jgi:large subunit ribosomal protein L2
MGKRIIAQRRGKGSSRYRAHSFKFKGSAKHPRLADGEQNGIIIDLIKCPAHTAPLAQVEYEGGEMCLMLAGEGMSVGDSVYTGSQGDAAAGNTMSLSSIPEGTLIYNIEGVPGDGGKFVRASGTFARVVTKGAKGIVIKLPSRKQKIFNEKCRATIGVLAGGGRLEKPLLKAGTMHYKMKARNHLYPRTSAGAMNAVDHPFGNKRSLRKSNATPVSRHAPPGAKVGMIAARRTGRKKK